MIINSKPLSMAETLEYINKDENTTEIAGFIKKFNKLDIKEARALKEEIENLNLVKMTPEGVVKILDLLPETAEELNKIFIDVGLDEDETKKILDIIKKYK